MTLRSHLKAIAYGTLGGITFGTVMVIGISFLYQTEKKQIPPFISDYCSTYHKGCKSNCLDQGYDFNDPTQCVKGNDSLVGSYYICDPDSIEPKREACLKSVEERTSLCRKGVIK